MGRRRWLLLVIAGAAATLLLARGLAGIYTDYLWYAALGATEVWRAKYLALLVLRGVCGVAATLFVFANLYAVRQSVVSLVLPRRIGNLDIGEEVPRRQLTWTAAALSSALGIALAWTRGDWSGAVAARVGQPFGESDPYYATDLGYFVYRLPFELSLFQWWLTVVLIVIGVVVILYALTPSLRWEQGGLYVSAYVRRHLAMLAGTLLLVLAWHYRLEMYTMLSDARFGDDGFGYIDHHVGIPATLLLSIVTLGAGLTVLWAGWTGQMRLVFAALTGVLVAALGARQIAPFVAERVMADADPAVRERPYQATRAGYTRRAFAVDRIVVADSLVRYRSLADAAPFVPVWDAGALRRAADRTLPGSAVGWVMADSGIIAALPGTNGAATTFLASVAEPGGAPVRARSAAGRSFAQPVLILPDSNARATIVADSLNAIRGAPLTSTLSRIAHALAMQDFRVWLGDAPTPNPRLVSRRTVRERVAALAPFFVQGAAVTPIWFGGQLSWSLDLYSASRTYPLSRHVIVTGAERSYFQHAATALVNAATGHTVLVVDSLIDPIAATWIDRFPSLFARPASLPMAVRQQLPPPRESARAQATAFGRVGLRGEAGVERRLPDDEGPDSALARTPAPLVAYPGLGTTAFVLPLLDRSDRIRGLFIAEGGPSSRSLWLPMEHSAMAWGEGLDRLQSADTLPQTQLVRGYVRAIPVGNDLLLAQPRYDWRGAGAPRLLYVSVLVGDSVRTAPTLLELAGHLPLPARVGSADFRARVAELYDEMRRAITRGDWAAYGQAFDALGALVRQSRQQEP